MNLEWRMADDGARMADGEWWMSHGRRNRCCVLLSFVEAAGGGHESVRGRSGEEGRRGKREGWR